MSLESCCWSPAAGDRRLAFVHERDGDLRPGIWDLATGERSDLRFDLGGDIRVESWWPDASALLLAHRVEGRDVLLRYELGSGSLERVWTELGIVWKARVRPDGRVWLESESAQKPRRIVDDTGAEVVTVERDHVLQARPFDSWHFENEHGQRVHGFLATPVGGGPFPVVMLVHGGPTWLDLDRWHPDAQALVDAGFAVGMVNYRGSLGYGREWRDALIGNVGGPELEDVNAGLRDLVERGIADPERAVIAGGSWGGYVTLGRRPVLEGNVDGEPVLGRDASSHDARRLPEPVLHPSGTSARNGSTSPPANGWTSQHPASAPVSSWNQIMPEPSTVGAPSCSPMGWSVTCRRAPVSRSSA